MIYRRLILCVFLLFDPMHLVKSQSVSDEYHWELVTIPVSKAMPACTNMDFESGDFTGWTGYTGTNSNRYGTYVGNVGFNTSYPYPQHLITVAPDVDTCSGLSRVAPGGAFSARLGNGQNGGYAERLTQTFTVDSSNNVFSYQYHVVLDEPTPPADPHTIDEAPTFEVMIYDDNNDIIPCSYYRLNAVDTLDATFYKKDCWKYNWMNPAPPDVYKQMIYTDWLINTVDLTPYIGQDVTVVFTTYDCKKRGHFAYAYIDASCKPQKALVQDTVCEGQATTIAAASSGIAYDWLPTGDTTRSINVNTSGTYTVTITKADGCNEVEIYDVQLDYIAGALADFDFNSACNETQISFYDSSSGSGNITSWSWDFGDGNTSSAQNPIHNYANVGDYNITLMVTLDNGCTDTVSDLLSIAPPPQANFSSDPVCLTQFTNFTDLSQIAGQDSIISWFWEFGEPSSGNDNFSTDQNPDHTYSSAGIFNVYILIKTNSGCEDSISFPVEVYPLPNAIFGPTSSCLGETVVFQDSSYIAKGNIVNWSWNFGDSASGSSNTSTAQNPSHQYNTVGSYNTLLTVTSDQGCVSSVSQPIVVAPLPTALFIGENVCLNEQSCFADASFISGGNISSWLWDFGDGNTSALQNPCHVYANSGTYSVTLTVGQGSCQATYVMDVEVYPFPLADFNVNPARTSVLDPTFNFQDASLGVDSFGTWYWGDGSDTNYVVGGNHQHTYYAENVPGGYRYAITLDVINKYGCPATVTKEVIIDPYWTLYIPDAFTPNGDVNNETFFAKGIGILEYEMWIYDRWGNQIFHCNIDDLPQDPLCHWNGKVENGPSGLIAQQDVYVWLIEFKDIFYKKHKRIGHVSMVR